MKAEQHKRYLESGGGKCPYCRSDQIEGREVNVEAGMAVQGVSCLKCGMRWYDHYEMIGVFPDAHNEGEPQDEPTQTEKEKSQ